MLAWCKKTAKLSSEITKDRSLKVIAHDMRFVAGIAKRLILESRDTTLSEGSRAQMSALPKLVDGDLG